jgi:hypothetical protein
VVFGLDRAGREFPGYLVAGDLGQAPGVPSLSGERGGQEDLGEADRVLDAVHPRAEAEHVGVVVQAGSSVQATAARTPGILFTAICSPFPEPPITMPTLPGSLMTAWAALIT